MKPECLVGGKVTAYLMASKYGLVHGDATGFVAPAPGSYFPFASLTPYCLLIYSLSRITIHSPRLSMVSLFLSVALSTFGFRLHLAFLYISRPFNLFLLSFLLPSRSIILFPEPSIIRAYCGAPLYVRTSLGVKIHVCADTVVIFYHCYYYGKTVLVIHMLILCKLKYILHLIFASVFNIIWSCHLYLNLYT